MSKGTTPPDITNYPLTKRSLEQLEAFIARPATYKKELEELERRLDPLPKADEVKDLNMAVKYDDDKIKLELIPPEMIYALGTILSLGAKKYAERNWEKGMKWGRCYGALMRHLWCWWGGKAPTTKSFLFGELDPETGHSHLWHAACCIAFLITYEERKIGEDDRYESSFQAPRL
jgi:hypothetical protein